MRKQALLSVSVASLTMLALAGCAGTAAAPAAPTAPVVGTEAQSIIDGLPEALSSQYTGAASGVELSSYADFEKVEGPWKICYSDSYQGNAWRVAVSTELERLADQYKTAGLVSEFQVAVSENDVARQNQQIRQFVEQDCSVIITAAGSSTGLNQAIEAAAAAGVPVVTIAGAVTSPAAINVDSNYSVLGTDLAEAVSAASDNVLMVKGIEGNPVAVQQNEAAKATWAADGTKIVGEVNGDWTPSITKEAVLNAITTNPADIGAVWSTGSETAVIAQAFKDSGRAAPLITGSITGDALGFWKEDPSFKFDGVALVPSWTAQTGFNIALRILDGQGPTLSTLMVPVPRVTVDDFDGMWRSCMTPDAASVFPVVPNDPLPAELMNAYFATGSAVGPFDYSQTPDPCAKS